VLERAARWRHSGALIRLGGPKSFVDAAERALFLRGAFVVQPESESRDVLAALAFAGALVITHTESDAQTVMLDRHPAIAVANVDELIRILEGHDILQGETKR
jgi:hypothetical protein